MYSKAHWTRSPIAAATLLLSLGAAVPAEAQILRKLKQKASEAIEKKIAGQQAEQPAAPASGYTAAAAGLPGEGVWVNYDFVPGERVLFFDDFTADNVGDFPRRLTLTSGSLEIAELGGARYLRATSPGEVVIPLPETLPERFTLELDFMVPGGSEHQFVHFTDRPNAPHVSFRAGEGGIEAPGGTRFVARAPDAQYGQFLPVRVMVDGKHAKIYLGGTRVANVPQVDLGRSRALRLRVNAQPDRPAMFGNIRVAAGGKELYDALAANGRVATQGILFDTGSDRIRPESTPTLQEIGEMLRAHPDLRITIEGHTDSVGDDASNQQLSEKRAAAVRDFLMERFGIEETRLEARGLGETQPVASDSTPEGRQQNRRVELVRR